MTLERPDWHRHHGLPSAAAAALDAALEALEARAELIPPLVHLLERLRDEGVPGEVLGDPLIAEALVRLAYAAPFLLRHLTRRPAALNEGVLSALSETSEASESSEPSNAPRLRPWRDYAAPPSVAGLSEAELMARLRAWKYDNYARLTAAELLGLHDARTTCRLISDLADGMLRIAYEYAFAHLTARQGLPLRSDGALAGGAVVGMGKLGGRELNYASDIDLIFVHAGDDAPCRLLETPPVPPIDSTGDPAAPWAFWQAQATRALRRPSGGESSGEFHNRLARQVTRLLSTQSAEGFGFRVDCDLRPSGRSGLLAPSLDFMERYYMEQGREWERTAMIKARVVAGVPGVAARFGEFIRPFVYRRYLDYSALEGVAIVKHDIDRTHQAARQRNLKVGLGGIRENEFLVQALQLLYGGKRPELQVTGHDEAVTRLVAAGVLEEAEGESIRADYWALRRVENRLQMVEEAQTHDLPEAPEALLRVLHDFRPGFPARLPAALEALDAARRRTAERFRHLFAGLSTEDFPASEAWREAVRSHIPPERHEEALARLDDVFGRMMTTRVGERCVFKLAKLLGREEVYRRGSEDAFPRWLDFFEQIGTRNAIYTLIESHPPIVPWIAAIFSEGGHHALPLIRHPEFLESFFALGEDWLAFLGRADDIRQQAQDEEELILELQTVKSQGVIRTLTAYLRQEDSSAHRPLLSDLADATVEACTRFAWRRLCERMGLPEGARADAVDGFAVLAMGKLGSREMRFGSDLDLVFVYREEGATSQGRSHYEFYTKLAQRIGTLLTAPTQFGKLYDLDHRLRPFGSKGVLVPSLSAYRSFLLPGEASGADVWNFQAFTRIRTVCGDAALGDALIAAIAEAWDLRNPPRPALGRAVWEMLNLLVEQNARGRRADGAVLPLKFAVGGMMGYEFLQQAYFLCDRRAGSGWTPPPPREIMERLEADVVEVGALDERLSFYERDGRHELRAEHCQTLAALGARWRFEEIEALCSRMEGEIAAAFRELST